MTRKERINQARKSAAEQIAIKKANLQKYGEGFKAMPSIYKPLDPANKADLPKDEENVIYRTIIANTYNWMDSHEDVHLNGVFSKTIKETKKIFLLHDHEYKLTSQTGTIIKSYEKELSWQELGIDAEGKTMALLHDVKIEKDKNPAIFEMYKNGEIDQHSVGMQYVKIDFAADDPDDKEAYSIYTAALPNIGNKEEVQEKGYFFAVSEAKLRETSAVLKGSNILTGVYDENKDETEENKDEQLKKVLQKFDNIDEIDKICKEYKDTLCKNEPPVSTQKSKKPSFYVLMSK